MTFNPASIFVNTTNLSSAQAKRMEQRDDIDHQPRVAPDLSRRYPIDARSLVEPKTASMIQWLEQAAARFAVRRDDFAQGKSGTCLDIAAKLNRYGAFASDRQEDFAKKLILWSLPRGAAMPWDTSVPSPVDTSVQARTSEAAALVRANPALPKLHALMQRLSKLTIGKLQIVRKNGDSLCWIKHEDAEKVIGRLTDGGALTLWQRPMVDLQDVTRDLLRIEADPEAAAVLHGKLSGRCSVCSRDLTDPASIERGIGPICADKF